MNELTITQLHVITDSRSSNSALCRLRVVRIDPLRFLTGCRTSRLNQALSVTLSSLLV